MKTRSDRNAASKMRPGLQIQKRKRRKTQSQPIGKQKEYFCDDSPTFGRSSLRQGRVSSTSSSSLENEIPKSPTKKGNIINMLCEIVNKESPQKKNTSSICTGQVPSSTKTSMKSFTQSSEVDIFESATSNSEHKMGTHPTEGIVNHITRNCSRICSFLVEESESSDATDEEINIMGTQPVVILRRLEMPLRVPSPSSDSSTDAEEFLSCESEKSSTAAETRKIKTNFATEPSLAFKINPKTKKKQKVINKKVISKKLLSSINNRHHLLYNMRKSLTPCVVNRLSFRERCFLHKMLRRMVKIRRR